MKIDDALLISCMFGIQIANKTSTVEDFIKWKDKIIKEGVQLDEK